MKILVVEDEDTVAQRLQRLSQEILGDELERLWVFHTLDDAQDFLATTSIDLLFLDLNLAGRDGFDLLKQVVSQAFHTVVVSANAERAIEAFEYGVLDFVAKPFTKGRLEKALERYSSSFRQQHTKFIAIKRQGVIESIKLDDVVYFQGANIYSEACMSDGQKLLHDKPLTRLQQLLPEHFERVHKSYIVNNKKIEGIKQSGNNAELILSNDELVPISRGKIAELKSRLI